MGWSFLKDTSSQVEIGAFGKIPSMGDFVRVGCKPLSSFETWVQAGMAAGEAKYKERWPAIYSQGAMYGFVFHGPPAAKESHVMSGILCPSVDAVGRRFPLVVFSSYKDHQAGTSAQLAPLFLGNFLADAAMSAREGVQLASADALKERLGRIPTPSLDAASVSAAYTQWIYSTPLRSIWHSIYGDPGTDVPVAVLGALVDCVGAFQGRENLTTLLGIRLPLGAAGVLNLVFWMDLVRRVASWRHSVPTLFWSVGREASSVLLHLGVTPPSTLPELWQPDTDNDSVYDLTFRTTMATRRDLLARLPGELRRTLERWDASAADLLLALGR